MEFIRKNFVTVLVVGATVVLAGVAMFTAMRLYQLRQNPVTPNEPASTPGASDAPITVRPASGNWNLPENYILTNTSDADVVVVWNVDCWDENLCEDSTGTETLASGDSMEKGLGSICSQWQLQLNWSGTQTEQNDVWDWSGVAELGSECDVEIASTEEVVEVMEVDEASESALTTTEVSADIETFECTTLAFSLEEAPVGGTATLSPVPSATVKPTATPTTVPSAIATASATVKPTATPATELPAAGVSIPTVFGISAGAILLLLAFGLAL